MECLNAKTKGDYFLCYLWVMTYDSCSMNNKNTKSKLPTILIAVGLLLVVGVVASFIFQDKLKTIATNIENSGKPNFILDTAKFPDWASTGNIYGEGTAPVTSFSAQQCAPGSECSNLVEGCRTMKGEGSQCEALNRHTKDGCMVQLYYFKQAIDPKVAVSDELKEWSSFGTKPTKTGVKTLTMRTSEGDKEYQFYQYDTNNSDDMYKRGSAFGFVALKDGHIEVRGVCKEASQLDQTLPILNAVSLKV